MLASYDCIIKKPSATTEGLWMSVVGILFIGYWFIGLLVYWYDPE